MTQNKLKPETLGAWVVHHGRMGCCRFRGHLVKVESKPEVVDGNETTVQPGVQA
jgi:hypothetical protein